MLSLRLTIPADAVSFHRKVNAPHKLSDGALLQPSIYLAIAAAPLAMSELIIRTQPYSIGLNLIAHGKMLEDKTVSRHRISLGVRA